MKYTTLKTLSTLALVGLTALTGACGSVVAAQPPVRPETQAVAITTPAVPELVAAAEVKTTLKPEPAAIKVAVIAEEAPVEASTPIQVSAMVQDETESFFHLAPDGYLQRSSEALESDPATQDLSDGLTPEDSPVAELKADGQSGEVTVHLNSRTQAANLRSGPGLSYEVVKIIQSGADTLVVHARTVDGWLQVTHDGDKGWLAADLVEANDLLSTLLVVEAPEAPAAAAPEPTPAPEVVETAALQPIYCYETPIRGFGKVWGEHLEVQNRLNCPAQFLEQGTNAAIQQFQHGFMLWLETDTVYNADPVYVFFNDGTYQRFGDLGPADPAKIEELPAGAFEVGDKFAKVYWEGTGVKVKERLGCPTTEAIDSPGAFQQFYNGRMFWAGAIDRIFVIYDYYEYQNDRSIHISDWDMYEDNF